MSQKLTTVSENATVSADDIAFNVLVRVYMMLMQSSEDSKWQGDSNPQNKIIPLKS